VIRDRVAFWDASAIVPLCCIQPSSSTARALLRRFPRLVTWWGTTVELRSALARLCRERHITQHEFRHGTERIEVLRGSWAEIVPTDRVRSIAERLPLEHPVRAADAFQLAAALVWTSERPRGRPFVCLDRRLSEAAAAAGFRVVSRG
jgi:predicted nucleic acid-binding protein